MMERLSAIWRRLDVPGHDACRFEQLGSGWRLEGSAIFRHEGAPAHLAYRVSCDREWRTRAGHVRGFVGTRLVEVAIERTAEGVWLLDGLAAPELERCVHLDFGFTPATNFQQLRQLDLQIGERAELPVAWLDVPDQRPLGLQLLVQHYARRSESAYWYEAPRFDYDGLLELTRKGIVARYPGLWELEVGGEG